MDIVKILGIGIIGLFIIIVLRQYKPEFAIYASIICGTLIFILCSDRLREIISLLRNLTNKSGVNYSFLTILLKITGIAFLTEFGVNICKDSGETAVASKIEFGGKILIMAISIPIISALLETILKLLP